MGDDLAEGETLGAISAEGRERGEGERERESVEEGRKREEEETTTHLVQHEVAIKSERRLQWQIGSLFFFPCRTNSSLPTNFLVFLSLLFFVYFKTESALLSSQWTTCNPKKRNEKKECHQSPIQSDTPILQLHDV